MLHTDKGDGCEVCIVVKNFQSSDVPSFGVELALLEPYVLDTLAPLVVEAFTVNKGYNSTAPPRIFC